MYLLAMAASSMKESLLVTSRDGSSPLDYDLVNRKELMNR
jgi:hypothetical protein